MNTIIKNQRAQKLNTYVFFGDAVECFNKHIWLKDCLLEMYNLGYDPNTLKVLHEINKETDIIIRTPIGSTDNMQVKEVIKQAQYLDPSCAVQKYPQKTALEKKQNIDIIR